MAALTCCVCGASAGDWKQHWDRDTGYGICPRCAAEQAARETAEELASLYGQAGVNYGRLEVHHMGRRYQALAVTKRQDLANTFMLRNPGAALLLIQEDGALVLADKDDLGEPVSPAPSEND